MAENTLSQLETDDKEYITTDRLFAAYLMTRKNVTFLGAEDTGQPLGKGKRGTKKQFVFVMPKSESIDQHQFDLETGTIDSHVPFRVAARKLMLIQQACNNPVNLERING